MKAGDAAIVCVGNLARRKGRTALTVVGVVIGVAALVMMVSLAIGLEREVLKIFQNEDSLRTIFVSRIRPGATKGKKQLSLFDFGTLAVPITERDLEDLRKLPGVEYVRPDLNMLLHIEIEDDPDSGQDFVPVGGFLPQEAPRLRRYLIAGKPLEDPDERAIYLSSRQLSIRFQKKPEEIIGKRLVFARAFIPEDEEAPPPETMTYRVAGVLDSEKLGIRGRELLVPMSRAMELRELTHGGNAPILLYKKGSYLSAEVYAKDMNAVDDLKKQLGNSGYQVLTTADIMGTVRTIFLIIQGFMGCIGAIGLIVSIFGIANTMAMAVLERTREIGIMKALGARSGDIGSLFLFEASAIGLLGGLAGLLFGKLGGDLLNLVAHQLTDIPDDVSLFHVSLWLAVGSVCFAIFVSVVAGLMPALRAARLDPVRALRYE